MGKSAPSRSRRSVMLQRTLIDEIQETHRTVIWLGGLNLVLALVVVLGGVGIAGWLSHVADSAVREPVYTTNASTGELDIGGTQATIVQSGEVIMLGMLPYFIEADPIEAMKAAPSLVIIREAAVGDIGYLVSKVEHSDSKTTIITASGEILTIYDALNGTVTHTDGVLTYFCAACTPVELKSLVRSSKLTQAWDSFTAFLDASGEDCLNHDNTYQVGTMLQFKNITVAYSPQVCQRLAAAIMQVHDCPKNCSTQKATCDASVACTTAIAPLVSNLTMVDVDLYNISQAVIGIPAGEALLTCYEDMVAQCPGIIPTLPSSRKRRDLIDVDLAYKTVAHPVVLKIFEIAKIATTWGKEEVFRPIFSPIIDHVIEPVMACHPAMSVVELCGGGSVRMDELVTGAMIRTQFGCEPVTGFTHQQKNGVTDYFLQQTLDNHTLFISTVDHYGFANGIEVAAADICVGDTVRTLSASGFEQASVVTHIGMASLDGAYHLMTPSGTYYVDGVLASTFTGQVPRSVWTVLTHYTTLRYNLGFPVAPDDDTETTLPLDLVYNMYHEKVPEWMEVALLPVFLTSGVLIELFNSGLLQLVAIGFICKTLTTKMMSARTK